MFLISDLQHVTFCFSVHNSIVIVDFLLCLFKLMLTVVLGDCNVLQFIDWC